MSATPPDASSAARDLCVSACSSRPRSLEAVADPDLQLVELVAQPHDARADVLAMAVDDAPRLVGLPLGHRHANLAAQRVDRHRQDRLRVATRAKALDAVTVEQRDDDAGFDVGGGGEDDDRLVHASACASRRRRERFAHLLHPQQHHRHVVLLQRGSGERVDLAQDALAQLVGGQIGMLADQAGQPRVAEAVAFAIHRLGDPVGIEHEQIAGAERQRHLLEQPVERAPLVELQAEHQTVRRHQLRLAALRVGARHVDQRAVAGARVLQRPARRSTTR